MKTKDKKILIRAIIVTIILMVVVYGLNFLSRLSIYNVRYNIINNVKYQPEDSIDIMIVGNSHAQEGLNAKLISNILNSKTINFSFSQQQTPTAYYFMKKNLKTQSPKIVMLEAYTLIQQYQNGAEFIPLTFDKIKFYSMLDEERNFINCFFPISQNHNFWARDDVFGPLADNLNAGKAESPAVFDGRIMSDLAVSRHETYDSYKRAKELHQYRFENLLEMKALCEKNDTELVLFMLPLYDTLVKRVGYDEKYYNVISDFCEENGIKYIDFNKQSDTNWDYIYFREQDYTHNTHLNAYGQYLASKEFAEFICELSDDFSLNDYTNPQIKTYDFLTKIDTENSLLIIDDCPKPIDMENNIDTYTFLKEKGVEIDMSSRDEENDAPRIYFISQDTVIYNYDLSDDFDYDKSVVSFYELDPEGNIIAHMAARWDFFDTGFIR